MAFPADRPRRLRRTPALRTLARETRVAAADLIHPAFVREGIDDPMPISTMPGQQQETLGSLSAAVADALSLGCAAVILFGIPEHKDATGSQAWNDQGIVQTALRTLRQTHGDGAVLIADCCLDEYTDHGHCGVLRGDGSVDNDATLELYGRIAVAQAAAGADIIAPSGMMDGQVLAIRAALDDNGFQDTAVLAYSAKFASVMYGPFRVAADCAPRSGDRHSYQMDVANQREAVREALTDVDEGADMLMVKPALTALDVVARVRDATDLPLAAYCVSGEYAMLHAAAAAGAFDERAAVLEVLAAIRRAGADLIISYDARQAARWLQEERNSA
ncbi:MAG: porphobilinogen synthase [Candidatus Dormibacteraeota bacterium]|uniref:Delta-aminolevulinic acid dehydratase n=1 Tax=Candidatus Amunia macphersoniae TaxID=3127014 RepID=A0A934KFL9_9BACT|nr:porphobilinogen synthase [Candidatus Dormibacteraeota bacterium]